MKKRICLIISVTILLSSFLLQISAKEGTYSWYIKRNGNKAPTFAKESSMVREHNGYFLGEGKKLYLTFDAGYENGNIEKILNTLKEENVPAAFFILDNLILKNTDLVKKMADEGHLVCNHTKNHRDLTKCSKEEIIKNISALEKIYEEKTGYSMAKYFRFPEGKYSETAISTVNELGYKTIFWSFAYDDWDNDRQPDAAKAIKKILSNTHDGAVILLHPTSKTNAEILPTLIKEWRSMGYDFGTLDDLTL